MCEEYETTQSTRASIAFIRQILYDCHLFAGVPLAPASKTEHYLETTPDGAERLWQANAISRLAPIQPQHGTRLRILSIDENDTIQ